MTEANDISTLPQEDRIARIVWAAHILSYLTKGRSHEQLHGTDDNVEYTDNEDESSDDDQVCETEKNMILTGPRDSVRRKFLDCIAQLMSPCKGWDGVTATAMQEGEDRLRVDIARNHGFGSDEGCFDDDTMEYCKMLEEYLHGGAGVSTRANTNRDSPTHFELRVIDYLSRRIDPLIEDFRKTLDTGQRNCHWNSQRRPGQNASAEAWIVMTNLISRLGTVEGVGESRAQIVQQACKCLDSPEMQQLLSHKFGMEVGLKVWKKLNFIARPLVDCQVLRSITIHEPQLRNCEISPILSRSKATLEAKHVIGIFKAWEALGLGSAPESVVRSLKPSRQRFEEECAKGFSLHAEMQLVMYYDKRSKTHPTFNYFGCSKKSCLLCETFLGALPDPIATRGRHGVCYAAWGVPDSDSKDIKAAVERLEKILVVRIQEVLHQKGFVANVLQSGMVSDFSQLTLDAWHQSKQEELIYKDKQKNQHSDRLIIEGRIPSTQSKYCPRENFEPEDCCVMCNSSPGYPCAKCQSTYYCSGSCENSDFPSHDLLCNQLATQPERPSSDHKRAIYFPTETDNPSLIWVLCRRQCDEDGTTWTEINPHPYLGPDNPVEGVMRIEHNPLRSRNLGSAFALFAPKKEGYCVFLIHRDGYLMDGSIPNRSISACVKVSCTAPIPHEYRGPMIAIRGIHHEDYADITLADFRHLMDYLISYRNTHIRESVPGLLDLAPTTTRGVKICCYGEVKRHGSDPFVAVDLTRANKISLDGGSISPVSVCLGMPIQVWKNPETEFQYNPIEWEEGFMADRNPNVAFLMMETDPSQDTWGFAPMSWNSEVGNAWAVREDGRDLAVNDIAMMCHFARHKLQRMFEEVMESDSNFMTRQGVLDFITWDNMVTFWDETVTRRNLKQD